MEARRDSTNAEEFPGNRSSQPSTRDRWNYQTTGPRAEPGEIWKARKLIAASSGDEISLTTIAVQIHISSNYLSEKFKRVTGENFVQYVARIRTGKATCLLRDSDSPITEIAFAVGFQSLSQFNRVFKKLTLQSPTQFRASYRPAPTRASGANIIGKNA